MVLPADKEKAHFIFKKSMPNLFRHIQFWEDHSLREPSAHMACDEALILSCDDPVLRAYRWGLPAITFGYAQRYSDVAGLAGGQTLMRRWSGGGVVFHGTDLTLALSIPASISANLGGSSQIYRSIHEAVLSSIQSAIPGARLVHPEECRCGSVCFESPVAFDIISGFSKICGGALRRSKRGVLYQGSLQFSGAEPSEIARSFAGEVFRFEKQNTVEDLARNLVASKYGTREWLLLR